MCLLWFLCLIKIFIINLSYLLSHYTCSHGSSFLLSSSIFFFLLLSSSSFFFFFLLSSIFFLLSSSSSSIFFLLLLLLLLLLSSFFFFFYFWDLHSTNHLDLESVVALADACQKFQGAIVFVSHDEYFCAKVLTSLWKCNGTSVVQIHGGFQGYKESVRDGFA